MTPSTDTLPSSMTSSSADCVLLEVLLISSAKNRLQLQAPERYSNFPVALFNIVNPTIETPNQVVTPETVQIPNIEGQELNNIPNPQAEKLNNVAVVYDPSLGNSGLNIQPNIGKQKNAGFTLNKYIVIGTVCILLAIAVVIVAYILIQKKINGA